MAKKVEDYGRKTIKKGPLDVAFDVINVVFLCAFTFICIFPFYYVLINSISSSLAVDGGLVTFYPVGIQFETYTKIFQMKELAGATMTSIARTVLGTVFTLVGSLVPGYLMTKHEFPHRKFWYRFMIVTMYFSAGLIPGYLNIKMLGLTNNFWVYVLPSFVTPYNMILTKTYIEGLPPALEEAAYIDGAGYFKRFVNIVIPLSKPIIATVAVFAAVGQWNSYMDTVIYMNGGTWPTLQSMLYQFLNQSQVLQQMIAKGGLDNAEALMANMSTKSTRFAITGVTVLPILFVYPFFQRYFTKGIMIGAVKG